MSVPRQTEDAVVGELLAFARQQQVAHAAQVDDGFSGIPEADLLIESDPNAFLLAALFTQGMPAERAWAGPYLLAQRLGHLDIDRIASMHFETLAQVFAAKPALHRFKREMALYIQSACRRLVDVYGGRAERIWSDAPTSRELQQRLLAFDGVGQKKAAMVTEILPRHFGVDVREPSGSDVAADVQVRRVMYRCGLSRSEEARDVIEAARLVNPGQPGLLDLACWLIGRRWCRPRAPNHESCRLGAVCPRVGAG